MVPEYGNVDTDTVFLMMAPFCVLRQLERETADIMSADCEKLDLDSRLRNLPSKT